MSDYIVDREHIRYLVNAAIGNSDPLYWASSLTGTGSTRAIQPGDCEAGAKLGQMLWDENIESIKFRYPNCAESLDNAPGPDGETYNYADHYRDHRPTFDWMQVIVSVKCYEYQSCEHPAWEASEAKAFCHALTARAVSELPGYHEKVWGAPIPMSPDPVWQAIRARLKEQEA